MSSLPSSFANPTIIQSRAQALVLPKVVSGRQPWGVLSSPIPFVSPLAKVAVGSFTNTHEAFPVCSSNCLASIINNLIK